MTTQAELAELNGEWQSDVLEVAKRWVAAVRRESPPSGLFLADDLDRIVVEIEQLRDAIDQALDDMGESGYCVCEDTKLQMIAAPHSTKVK